MRTRRLYIPITQAAEGMELAEAVKDQYLRTYLPAGLALTDEHLHQLATHHAEFICTTVLDTRTDEDLAHDTAAATERVQDIFEPADLSDPVTAALFNQVMAYRSA